MLLLTPTARPLALLLLLGAAACSHAPPRLAGPVVLAQRLPAAGCRPLGSVRGERHGSILFADAHGPQAVDRMLAAAHHLGATHVTEHEVIATAHAVRARGEAYACPTAAAPPVPAAFPAPVVPPAAAPPAPSPAAPAG